MKFLLDENVDPAIRDELRRLNPAIEIIKIGDPGVPPRGTLDPRILMWCEEHNFILVTNDRSSMPVHQTNHFATGHHFPGILSIRPNTTAGNVIYWLAVIWGASEQSEYFDQITHIPL